MIRKIVIITVISATATNVIGCTSLVGQNMFTGEDEGRLLLSTDAEGLRAFSDMQNGLVATGKASPDQDTTYHTTRRHQEEQRTYRIQLRGSSRTKKQ